MNRTALPKNAIMKKERIDDKRKKIAARKSFIIILVLKFVLVIATTVCFPVFANISSLLLELRNYGRGAI